MKEAAMKGEAQRIGVLFGGISAERQVSLDSGEAVLRSVQRQGHEAVAIDTAVPVKDWSAVEMDCAFIALHGPGGEDGRVQSVLELMGVPYTGSDVFSSMLAMDKWHSRRLFEAAGLPVPQTQKVHRGEETPDCSHLGERLFVKPNDLGSSIGCSVVGANHLPLAEALGKAFRYSESALVEPWLGGEEYFIGILADEALPSVRIECEGEFYDYSAKYKGGTQYHLPSGLSDSDEAELAGLALTAWRTLGCEGWGRVDFLRCAGRFYLMEINTVPGLTENSLVPKAAARIGVDFDNLVGRIIALAKKRDISHLPIIQSKGEEAWTTQEF